VSAPVVGRIDLGAVRCGACSSCGRPLFADPDEAAPVARETCLCSWLRIRYSSGPAPGLATPVRAAPPQPEPIEIDGEAGAESVPWPWRSLPA